MGAKQKLNSANFVESVVFARLLGLVTGSVAVFLLAAAALLVASWMAGDIRA